MRFLPEPVRLKVTVTDGENAVATLAKTVRVYGLAKTISDVHILTVARGITGTVTGRNVQPHDMWTLLLTVTPSSAKGGSILGRLSDAGYTACA